MTTKNSQARETLMAVFIGISLFFAVARIAIGIVNYKSPERQARELQAAHESYLRYHEAQKIIDESNARLKYGFGMKGFGTAQ